MTKTISGRVYVDEAPPIIGEIVELVVTGHAYRADAMTILHDTARALKRAASRAEALPAEYERVEIPRRNGRTLEFSGKLLAAHEWTARGGEMRMELWETAAGAWIAATFSADLITATVVPPGSDIDARKDAVMDQFEWIDRARSMVRKIGWTLREDVD